MEHPTRQGSAGRKKEDMKILGNGKRVIELQAMLIELDMDYHKSLNMAMDKRDFGKALKYSKLRDCIDELLRGLS